VLTSTTAQIRTGIGTLGDEDEEDEAVARKLLGEVERRNFETRRVLCGCRARNLTPSTSIQRSGPASLTCYALMGCMRFEELGAAVQNTSKASFCHGINATTTIIGYTIHILSRPQRLATESLQSFITTPRFLLSALAAQDSHLFPVQQRRERVVAPIPVIVVNI
jgi:hypothetical protein